MLPHNVPVRASFTALALVLASAVTACEASTPDDTSAGGWDASGSGWSPSDFDAGSDPMKAVPVMDTPPPDTITEKTGIFVSPTGKDTNAGTRAAPLATLHAAITNAAKVGKIVYACTGTYAEALVVADSISLIGGLDCSDAMHWKTGAAHSRIQSPTSPAATAKSITSPTRLEALDIIAPDANDSGASSIGFFADHAPGITIFGSTIKAGNGANGTNGSAAKQLTLGASARGADTINPAYCITSQGQFTGLCNYDGVQQAFVLLPGGNGGVGRCDGASGHDGGNGGIGGTGGLWQAGFGAGPPFWTEYQTSSRFDGGPGAPGVAATLHAVSDGAVAAEIGTLTSDGYTPANGWWGRDGNPGAGGAGGHGGNGNDNPTPTSLNLIGSGAGGPGGGAGGCPGLAGGAGTGGGASLGMALVESPLVLDGVTITAATGGSGGRGSVGSEPTTGGSAGVSSYHTSAGSPGASGGAPGVSTNGGNGPSVGILLTGSAPTLTATSKALPGTAAPAIPAVWSQGGARSVPATPAGLTASVKSL